MAQSLSVAGNPEVGRLKNVNVLFQCFILRLILVFRLPLLVDGNTKIYCQSKLLFKNSGLRRNRDEYFSQMLLERSFFICRQDFVCQRCKVLFVFCFLKYFFHSYIHVLGIFFFNHIRKCLLVMQPGLFLGIF